LGLSVIEGLRDPLLGDAPWLNVEVGEVSDSKGALIGSGRRDFGNRVTPNEAWDAG